MQQNDLFGTEVTTDEQGMTLALQMAQRAYDLNEVPVGAIVIQNGKVIGQGFNQPIKSNDPSAHAEVVAIRQAALHISNYRLMNSCLYVTVEPCTMCTGLLIHSRVQRLVFGTTEPKAGAIVSALQLAEQPFYNHKLQIQGGVMAEECATIMSGFFAMRRRRKTMSTAWDSSLRSE